MENWFRVTDGVIHVSIKAVPGASKTECAGIKDKRLKIRIASAPEDGRANAELVSWFAKALGCAKRDIRLVGGEKSRLKILAIQPEYGEQLMKMAEGERPWRARPKGRQ
ncbi:MAG: DUF167 domain-containing protein [Treponema sp.]|jgi:uncharacterized protein (TIGR00251 family)|nr:DUF167 domain-containing protein [Treponema sp.]